MEDLITVGDGHGRERDAWVGDGQLRERHAAYQVRAIRRNLIGGRRLWEVEASGLGGMYHAANFHWQQVWQDLGWDALPENEGLRHCIKLGDGRDREESRRL